MKVLFLFLFTLPLFGQQRTNFYSLEKEGALGQQIASDIRRQAKPFDNAVVDQYVKRIGEKLTMHLPQQSFVYQFEVIMLAEASEPVALPGGFVLISARWLLSVENEAEFAGTLAHSIGHLALRLATRQATQVRAGNTARTPLIFAGGWMGSHATTLIPRGFIPAQRAHELEADTFGIELASRAGYSGEAFRRYIARTQPADAETSGLPPRELRLAKIDDAIASAVVAPFSQTDEFRQIQEHVRKAVLPRNDRRPPTLRR